MKPLIKVIILLLILVAVAFFLKRKYYDPKDRINSATEETPLSIKKDFRMVTLFFKPLYLGKVKPFSLPQNRTTRIVD